MNLDEEAFLTAYLDGELDPDQRLRVDSALLTDPALSEDLRDLAAVRDLVSGLSHPGLPVDVSAQVVATIRRRRDAGPLARYVGVTAASWASRAVAITSAAAALVATASIGALSPAPVGADRAGLARVQDSVPRPDGVRGQEAPSAAPVRPTSLADAGRPASDPAPLAPGRDERLREREMQRLRALLDSPNLRKIFFVTDVVGGDPSGQVFELLDKKIPRRTASFGQFTVNLGIVNDPAQPGEATVFAVVMDDSELSQLRARLREAFPETVKEADPRPELVTELAEVGQVSVFPGTTVAGLIERTDQPDAAFKADPRTRGGLARFEREGPGLDPLPVPDFVDATEPAAPPPLLTRGGAQTPAPPPARRAQPEPSVILVWVAAPRKDGPLVR